MFKKIEKAIVMMLVLILLLNLIVGCTSNSEPVETDQEKSDQEKLDQENEKLEETPVEELVEEEEAYDFGGRTITYSCNWDAEPKPNSSEAEDKLIARIAEIEKKYNVKIAYLNIPYDEYLELYSSSILAGEPISDVAFLNSSWFFPTLVTGGFLTPLSDLDVFDFNEEKWNQDILKAATYKDKIYGFATGKTYPSLGIFFNKAIFEREGLPDLYELQRTGQWTWNKMLEIAQKATKDTDGDGIIDQWGFGGYASELAFIYSNNGAVTRSTPDGKEIFALNESNALEALQFFQDIHQKYKIVEFPPEGAAWDYPIQQFQDGRTAMFAFEWYIAGRYHEQMSDEYGFVMFPKGPKADDYVAVSPSYGVHGIASTVKNPNEVAMVWDDYTDPFPDEDEDSWKEEFENLAWDRETVDETIALMRDEHTVFSKLSSFPRVQEMMWGVVAALINGEKTPAQAIEEIAESAQAAIDDVLKVSSNE